MVPNRGLEPRLRSKSMGAYVRHTGRQSLTRLLRLYRTSGPTPNEWPLNRYALNALPTWGQIAATTTPPLQPPLLGNAYSAS
jgi:hypothetical protein